VLIADIGDSTIKRISPDGALQTLCVCYRDHRRITRPIAVASGKAGAYFLATGSSPDASVLAVVDSGGEARVLANGLKSPVAIAVSPSGAELYITEITQREITKYLLDQKGTVVERMTFARLSACPAGLCLDYNANVFVAVPGIGRVFVFSEGGKLSTKLWVPGSRPNSVAIAGSVLFIGESDLGAVWALPLPASAKGPTPS
jgi:sugar lactone lactonase YvrE